jgi:uncharacterized membrane protein
VGEPWFKDIVESVGEGIDVAGVAVIVIGLLLATAGLLRGRTADDAFRAYRQSVGKAILLGLEFLVAADIIRTVAVTPTLKSVAVLGGIVAIRTFLSFTLELELEGRWPWQKKPYGTTAPR